AVTGARLGLGASAQLFVTDDDRPALRVNIERHVLAEGLATTGVVTRVHGMSGPLTVSLTSTDTNKAVVPSSVVISNNQVSFSIVSSNNGVADGPTIVS